MKLNEVKTIDLNAKEWFDKINGNSYFSATIALNYGLDNQVYLKVPFQYGYGEHYETQCFKEIICFLNETITINDLNESCRNKQIILRSHKEKNCRKKDLKQTFIF